MPVTQTSGLFQDTIAEFGTIPRRGLLYFGAFAVVAAAVDLLTWVHQPAYTTVDYAMLAAPMVASVAVVYAILMSMVGRPPSIPGFAKFFASSLALVLLWLVGFAVLLAGASAKLGAVVALGVALIVAGLVVNPLLVGWPILEATSQRPVGPLRAIHLTKGLRWQLLFRLADSRRPDARHSRHIHGRRFRDSGSAGGGQRAGLDSCFNDRPVDRRGGLQIHDAGTGVVRVR